jgi:superfamily II DNA or RNA helicase
MHAVRARIAGEIEIHVADLPEQALELIKTALTVRNEDRDKQLQERVWGAWDLPEWITLYREERRRGGDHVILLPRGFAANLVAGLASLDAAVEWDDQRARADAEPGYFSPFALRGYQARAVADMLAAEQGFYECPAGGGKTVTMLGLMAYAQQRTLWITDKAGLVEQARARAAAFLGLEHDQVGKIGEDVWEERDLTICLRQTLWSRLWELDATSWFDKWGLVIFDEGHHLSSETLTEICRRCRSHYLFGTSATPAKSETRGRIVHSLVGPVVAKTERQELYELGVLVKPDVEVVRTGHDDDFWPTHDAQLDTSTNELTCLVPGCRKRGTQHTHRNNYSTVLKHLVESDERNELIARRIVSERGHVHLVASRQLKHLDAIRRACEDAGWDGPINMLRGEENAAGLSQHIAEAVVAGGQWELIQHPDADDDAWEQVAPVGDHGREAIIFSTVADEGLDIPPIDRVHVVFPMRQEAAVIQLVGRCERVADGKDGAVIVDYADRCSVFAEQALERDRVYRYVGYSIRERAGV